MLGITHKRSATSCAEYLNIESVDICKNKIVLNFVRNFVRKSMAINANFLPFDKESRYYCTDDNRYDSKND